MARVSRDLLVRWIADVTPFLRGTDQVEDALQSAARLLDDVADEGEDSARRLARAYDRAGDELRRSTKSAGGDAKITMKDAGKEAGSEFAQNLGESLASGDISGLVSGTAGGLVSTFGRTGPVAVAFAALAVVGTGVFQQIKAAADAAAEAARKAASDIYQGILADGADFVDKYRQQVVEQLFDPATTDEIITNAKKAADALDLNLGAALAGGPESIAGFAQEAYLRIDELQKLAQSGTATGAQREDLEFYGQVVTYLDTIQQGWKTAERAVTDYNAALQLAAIYAERASSYAIGNSTANQQLGAAAPYVTGYRD